MSINCVNYEENTLGVVLKTGYSNYKRLINTQWEVFVRNFKNTYKNNNDTLHKCYKDNINKILNELENISESLDNLVAEDYKKIKNINLEKPIKDFKEERMKIKDEISNNLASFPMKHDIYDMNSKQYLYFSYYIMSIFTMIYFINIQIKN